MKRSRGEHHGKPCPYCGETMHAVKTRSGKIHPRFPTRDHVYPKSRGGNTTLVVCSTCNATKRDLIPSAWLAWIARNMPHRHEAVARLFAEMERVL